ncbi:MAG: FAD-binding oxidoreductase [Oscillospiraceae bacterium]|nr:FAD-binding oxidoreductase [Oscillospiraceae bacterium]
MDITLLTQKLGELIGHDKIITDPEVVLVSSKDYIGFRQYERGAKEYRVPKAACVAKPKSVEDVSALLAFLNENAIDTVPRTGGSSVTQGVEPVEGGVIIDGSQLNEILELDETNMWVTVRCGTPLEYLENYLNKRGYTTGHLPQSLPMAHVGGLVATRSIGQWSTLYGGIEDLVVGLEGVLANGEIVRIKNNPRRSVGPDLRHIFIGSEGMLGFITEATLKIFNYAPENRWMHCYGIDSMKNGLAALREIMVQGYRPAVARLHDEVENERDLDCIAPEGWCVLRFLADGPKAIADATGEGIEKILKSYNTVDLGTKPMEHWIIHRNDVCDTMDVDLYYKMKLVADTCEISAPWSVIGDIHAAVLERMPKEVPTLFSIGGHSSHSYINGTNIYFTFGAGVKKAEDAEPIYMKIISTIMEETLKRGGSIAHHHGSGKYRTAWMPEEHGSSYALMYKLKNALDPKGILNKGVLLV